MPLSTFHNARLVGQPPDQTFTVQIDTSTGTVACIAASGRPYLDHDGGPSHDLGAQYVGPSLIDNHVHFSMWALASRRLDLMDCTSAAQVLDRVRKWLALPHQETYLVGQRMRVGEWPDLDSMNRTTLDTLELECPLVLFFAGFHSLCANSAALRKLGHTPDSHTGILLEGDCFDASVLIGEQPADLLDDLIDLAAREAR